MSTFTYIYTMGITNICDDQVDLIMARIVLYQKTEIIYQINTVGLKKTEIQLNFTEEWDLLGGWE